MKVFSIINKIKFYYNIEIKVFLKKPLLLLKRIYYLTYYRWIKRDIIPEIHFKNNSNEAEKIISVLNVDNSLKESPIDVIIPSIDKDFEVLPYTIASLREFILHPVKNIFVVAPPSLNIIELCKKSNCIFIDENSVQPFSGSGVIDKLKNKTISGWLFQQLLKLNGDTISTTEDFLVFDSDTILLKPHFFKLGNKFVFSFNEDYHLPYFSTINCLLGIKSRLPISFVSHYMLFNKTILKKLKKELELRNNASWYDVIINYTAGPKNHSFSEFETYVNFLFSIHPESIDFYFWHNKSEKRKEIYNFELMKNKLSKKYRSVSFHSYNQ